jgi:hypothetical protein
MSQEPRTLISSDEIVTVVTFHRKNDGTTAEEFVQKLYNVIDSNDQEDQKYLEENHIQFLGQMDIVSDRILN